jgi:hypothetical protein
MPGATPGRIVCVQFKRSRASGMAPKMRNTIRKIARFNSQFAGVARISSDLNAQLTADGILIRVAIISVQLLRNWEVKTVSRRLHYQGSLANQMEAFNNRQSNRPAWFLPRPDAV